MDFRFEKFREKLIKPLKPEEFSFKGNIPEYYTRMKAVERQLEKEAIDTVIKTISDSGIALKSDVKIALPLYLATTLLSCSAFSIFLLQIHTTL